MTKIRAEVKRSKWALPRNSFLSAYYYALQYNEWKDMRDSKIGLSTGPSDGMPKGRKVSNPTEQKGIMAAEYSAKMKIIEKTAKETSEDLYIWILKAVTNEGITYNYLKMVMNIPCGKNMYYELRRKFYYLLAQKIKVGDSGDKKQ